MGAEQRQSGRQGCSPGGEGSPAEALCCSRHFPGCCSLGHSCSPLEKKKKSQALELRNGIWGCAVSVELLLYPWCRPGPAAFPGAAGSALHVLAASLVLMFSFITMSGRFFPFKAWHLRGAFGLQPWERWDRKDVLHHFL